MSSELFEEYVQVIDQVIDAATGMIFGANEDNTFAPAMHGNEEQLFVSPTAMAAHVIYGNSRLLPINKKKMTAMPDHSPVAGLCGYPKTANAVIAVLRLITDPEPEEANLIPAGLEDRPLHPLSKRRSVQSTTTTREWDTPLLAVSQIREAGVLGIYKGRDRSGEQNWREERFHMVAEASAILQLGTEAPPVPMTVSFRWLDPPHILVRQGIDSELIELLDGPVAGEPSQTIYRGSENVNRKTDNNDAVRSLNLARRRMVRTELESATDGGLLDDYRLWFSSNISSSDWHYTADWDVAEEWPEEHEFLPTLEAEDDGEEEENDEEWTDEEWADEEWTDEEDIDGEELDEDEVDEEQDSYEKCYLPTLTDAQLSEDFYNAPCQSTGPATTETSLGEKLIRLYYIPPSLRQAQAFLWALAQARLDAKLHPLHQAADILACLKAKVIGGRAWYETPYSRIRPEVAEAREAARRRAEEEQAEARVEYDRIERLTLEERRMASLRHAFPFLQRRDVAQTVGESSRAQQAEAGEQGRRLDEEIREAVEKRATEKKTAAVFPSEAALRKIRLLR